MPLKCRFTGSERKRNSSRRQKMATNVAFRLLKIVVIRKARIQKGVPLAESARKETVKV